MCFLAGSLPLPPGHPPGQALCDMGYSASDIITTLFRVVKSSPGMNEYLKLEYIKVRRRHAALPCPAAPLRRRRAAGPWQRA